MYSKFQRSKKKCLRILFFDQVLWKSLKSSDGYRHRHCQGYTAGLNSGCGDPTGCWGRGKWVSVNNVYIAELRGGRGNVPMSPQVLAKVGSKQKRFTTVGAAVGLAGGVDLLMFTQSRFIEEAFAAAVADVRPRFGMLLLVLL